MYDVYELAEYVIWQAYDEHPVSNLKLQKILYYIQAQFLVSTGKPCFPDPVEAWSIGPVIPSIYRRYKVYGSSCIPVWKDRKPQICFLSHADRKMVDMMIHECSKYTASDLTQISCAQKPWLDNYVSTCTRKIPNDSIRDFFA